MHLHTMTLQALGPFAGRHTIDVATLGAGGLFLLEGPTGAGKSTLLDAIVFGLYGKVAAEGTSDDRLRSAFAPDTTETFVDLVFEVSAGIYRIRRTPAYTRAKRRGDGTTTVGATGRLWRLPADWQAAAADPDALDRIGTLISTRLDVIAQEVIELVGLDRAQFAQTVVLPQGEFARFLKARPEDRRVLLQRIFGTGIYERIAERLAELRRTGDREVDAARLDALTAGATLVGAARLSPDDAAQITDGLAAALPSGLRNTDGLLTRVSDLVDAVAARSQQEAEATARAAATARSDAAAASAAAAEQERLDRLLRERDTLQARQAAHLADEPQRQQRARRLLLARAAAQVAPVLTRARRAHDDRTAAVSTWRRTLAAAPPTVARLLDGADAAVVDGGTLDPWLGTVDAHRTETLSQVGSLTAAARAEQGLDQLRAELATARDGLAKTQGQVDTVRALIDARPQERARQAARQKEASDRAGSVDHARAAAEQIDRHVAALADLDAATAEHDRVSAQVAQAREQASAAVAAEARARQAYVDGLAGALAADLETGQPCPVCGAVEHPAPATGAPEQPEPQVDRAAVDAAATARHDAETVLADAVARRERLAERIEHRARDLNGRDRDELLAQRDAARREVEAATAAQAQATRLEAELARFDEQTSRLTTQLDGLLAQVAQLTSRAEVLADRATRDEALVAQARDGHPSVSARRAAAERDAASAAAVVEALHQVQTARDESRRWDEHLHDQLAQNQIPSIAAATDALLPQRELAELTRRVDDDEARGADLARRLADPEIAGLPHDAVADLPAARAAATETAARADAAERTAAIAARVAADVTDAVTSLLRAAAALNAAVEANAPVVRMAGVASGQSADNARNLSLAAYVLQRRFADVIDAANTRLGAMSDGRYTLTPSQTREDVTARATGLAMRVVDQWTGTTRDPRTLSGGEAFYVSLCLALGLADVVSAEAGGVEMSTLFVDEGFGSLDPQVLDHVLAELGKLRAGGRTVGVVSHVETLKQAIADRVEVRVLSDGSSTLRVLSGGS